MKNIRTCAECDVKFELLPGKPGYADRCPACSAPRSVDPDAVRIFQKHGRMDSLKAEIEQAEVEVFRAKMDNDPHEIAIKRNRVDKLLKQLEKEAG